MEITMETLLKIIGELTVKLTLAESQISQLQAALAETLEGDQ